MFIDSWFQALLNPYYVPPILSERIPNLGLTSIFISHWNWSTSNPPITAFSDVMKEQKEHRGGAPVTMLPWTPSLVSLVRAQPKLAQDKGAGHTIYAFA